MTKDGQPMTKEQILAKWDSIGEFARNKGNFIFRNLINDFY
jgi:hypothetical protein